MDRAALDRVPTDQLWEEARKYQLQETGDRRTLIDTIMSHFERHAPTTDFGAQTDDPVTASTMRQIMMAVSKDILRHQREMQNQQLEFLQRQQEQLALLTQAIVASRENPAISRASREPVAVRKSAGPAQGMSLGQVSTGPSVTQWSSHAGRGTNPASPGNIVKWLASQIPSFAGAEADNVIAWIRRVEKVAEIHAASDRAVLLAASSKFTGSARRWYDIQDGPVIESWINLRRELIRMFDRKVPFYRIRSRPEFGTPIRRLLTNMQ